MTASSTVATAAPNLAEREITITRLYDAPPALVFKAWTDPAMVAKWWGPRGFTNPVCEVDARPGGRIRIVMRAPDGNDYPMRGELREVVAAKRLVFTNCAVDADDNALIDGLTTVLFEEEGGKTRLTLTTRGIARVPQAVQWLQGMETGWTMSLEKLGDQLAL